jgi:hypothetical protein
MIIQCPRVPAVIRVPLVGKHCSKTSVHKIAWAAVLKQSCFKMFLQRDPVDCNAPIWLVLQYGSGHPPPPEFLDNTQQFH